MLKEKRINYAIGFIFCILILSFMFAPYLGDATCYEILDIYAMMQIINESSPLITAIYAFLIMTLIAVSLIAVLAVTGFVLKCTKYKQSKAENIISVIYSSMLFFVIATLFVLLALSFLWLTNAQLRMKYGFIVLFAIIILFPYFCATKFNFAFTICILVLTIYLGIILLILHEKIFKPACHKTTLQPETIK